MSIIRSPRTHNYTILDNTGANDPRLSWGGVGLLTYLLTKPDNWQVSVAHLTKFRALGRDGVYKLLAELEECGYLKKSRAKADQGRFSKFEYLVYDRPQGDTKPPLTDIPEMDSPLPDLPDTVKPTLVNTDKKVSTENISITPQTPQKSEKAKAKKSPPVTEIPDWLKAEDWQDFKAHRQFIKKAMSPIAEKRMINTLAKLHEEGEDVAEAINQSIISGWSGVFPVKNKNPAGATTSAPGRAQPQQHKGSTHENYSRPRNRAERCESAWERNVEALERSLAEEAEAELDRRTVDEASCDIRGEVVRLLPRKNARHG